MGVNCPECPPGVYKINVLNDNGRDSNDMTHTIVENICSVSPSSAAGGDVITITGSSLTSETGSKPVLIGSSECIVTSATATTVECIVTGPSQTANLQIRDSNTVSITVTNNSPSCTIAGSYSPAYEGDIVVNCDSPVSNPKVFIASKESTEVTASNNDVTFKKSSNLSVGTHDVIIIGDSSASTAQLTISYAVD